MKRFYKVVRIGFGLVYFIACIDKILHPAAFSQAVYNYQVLPDGMVNVVAIVLPWLELALGVLLVAGVWELGAVLLSSGLMALFFAVLAYNQMRGLNVACGCFSTAPTKKGDGVLNLIRDGLFLAMGGYLFVGVFMNKHFKLGVSHA